MAKPLLRTCCLCQTLRIGSVISGILAILLAIASLICMFTIRLTYKPIFFSWIPEWIVKIVLAFNLCMTILISILMLIGVRKRNHYLMLPWVVLGFMLVVTLFISIIYNGVIYIMDGHYWMAVAWLIVGMIISIIYAYMWAVVYSHFTEIREETKRGKYNRQPYRR